MITRRDLLLSGGGVVIAAGATLPLAHDDATLDARCDVLDVKLVEAEDSSHDYEVDAITLELSVSAKEQAVEPVVFVWGQYHWMMQSWSQAVGPSQVAPGEDARIRVDAPGPKTRVYATVPAQVTVVDAGTEARTKTSFVPTEVADGGQ